MPKEKSLRTILESHDFLKGLPAAYLDLLTGCASNLRFEEGGLLCKAGEDADKFFLIRKGRVAIEMDTNHRKKLIVQTLDAGEFLGWSWLIAPYRVHFTSRAVEPVVALSFDAKCLRAKMEKDHELGYEMFKRFAVIISKRLEEVMPQIVSLYA